MHADRVSRDRAWGSRGKRDINLPAPDIYFDHDRFSGLAALADLQPCLLAGRVTEDQIKRTLGEAADICPDEIRAVVIIAGIEDAEK